MKQHVTVVPSDRLIIVDGVALCFDFPAPKNMHALQWHEGSGHIEWTDDINHPLTPDDYEADVAPFVALWEAEKARLDEKAAAAGAARIAEYNSEPARAARIRAERDRRLDATTWLVERHKEQTAGEYRNFDNRGRLCRTVDVQASTPRFAAAGGFSMVW